MVFLSNMQRNFLTKPLTQVMKEISIKPNISSFMGKKAFVSLIYKEHNEPSHPATYRSISLLNVGYKLFTCILAKRLNNLLVLDQTIFVSKRYMTIPNTPWMLLIILIRKNKKVAKIWCGEGFWYFGMAFYMYDFLKKDKLQFKFSFVEQEVKIIALSQNSNIMKGARQNYFTPSPHYFTG